MDKQQFLQKHGPIQLLEKANKYFARLKQPGLVKGEWKSRTGRPILRGNFYNIGYFPAGVDPTKEEQNWEALDHALKLTELWLDTLADGNCYALQSEGDGQYFPFIFAKVTPDGLPDFEEMSVGLTAELLKAYKNEELHANYDYDIMIEDTDDLRCLFWEDEFDDTYAEELDPNSYDAYRNVSQMMREELKDIVYISFYSDFVEFPVIYGGLTKHGYFVGLITSWVWT